MDDNTNDDMETENPADASLSPEDLEAQNMTRLPVTTQPEPKPSGSSVGADKPTTAASSTVVNNMEDSGDTSFSDTAEEMEEKERKAREAEAKAEVCMDSYG